MEFLTITQLQLLGVCIKVILEVRDWYTVRVVIIDAQATTYVDVLNHDMMSFQLVLQLVDSVAESLEVTHVKYLTTNVEVKSQELDVLHFCSFLDDALHIAHGDTELVLCQTGCDVGMSMSAHIRVDAEANLSYLILFFCKFIDNLKFWDALYIEAEDAFLQTEIDFPITLAYTCIYNLAGRETCLDGCLNLSSAHAVGS